MSWVKREARILLHYVFLGIFLGVSLFILIAFCLPAGQEFLQTLDDLFR